MRKTNKLRALLAAVCLLLLLAAPSIAADAKPETTALRVPWNVTEHRMKNGMRALLLPDHSAPMVVMKVWYAVGSRDEQPGLTGIAHFLEHMMFRGTKKYGPKVFSEIIKKNGGSHNAFTSFDYTAYYERIASDRLELIIELEADRMVNMVIEKAAFDAEKNVVHEERRSRSDRPTGKFWEQLRAVAYTNHSYKNPIIGWPEDMEAISIEDMEAFYKRYYSPENAVAVLVGDFKVEEAIAQLEKHFGKIPKSPTFKKRPKLLEFPQRSERRVYVRAERAASLRGGRLPRAQLEERGRARPRDARIHTRRGRNLAPPPEARAQGHHRAGRGSGLHLHIGGPDGILSLREGGAGQEGRRRGKGPARRSGKTH